MQQPWEFRGKARREVDTRHSDAPVQKRLRKKYK